MGAVAAAMAKAVAGARRRNPHRRPGRSRSIVADDRAAGVILDDGETISRRNRRLGDQPRTTFLDLLGPRHLDTGFVRRVRQHPDARQRRQAAPGARRARPTSAAPTSDAARHRALGRAPSRTPSTRSSMASSRDDPGDGDRHPVRLRGRPRAPRPPRPVGHRAICALRSQGRLGRRPRRLPRNASWRRSKPMRRASASWSRQPNSSPRKTSKQRYGFVGGNWHHGELAVEQMLFLRPVIGAAQYDTPIPGLWLAGAGSPSGRRHLRRGRLERRGAHSESGGQAMSDPRLHFAQPLLASPFHARTSAAQPAQRLGPLGRLHHRARL